MNKITVTKEMAKGLEIFSKGKKNGNDILKNIYIENGYLYATDGFQAIKIKYDIKDLATGCYKIIANNPINKISNELVIDNQDVQYPNVNQYFAAFTRDNCIKFNFDSANDLHELSKAVIKLYDLTKNGYNIEYIQNALKVSLQWTAYDQGETNAVLLVSGDFEVLLMPFKI